MGMATPNYTWPGHDLGEKGFTKAFVRRTNAEHTYRVERPRSWPWPTDNELICFCDNGSNNWGGRVAAGDTTATVTVYVD